MSINIYILPVLILLLFIYAFIKKVPAYETFSEGAKEALQMCFRLFPFLIAIFLAVTLFRVSGMAKLFSLVLSPAFELIGIPGELTELMLIRPLSGSASLTLLGEIYSVYGPDSYISRCASVIMGSSETIFYITAIYFSNTKVRSLKLAVPISIAASVFASLVACLILRVM